MPEEGGAPYDKILTSAL